MQTNETLTGLVERYSPSGREADAVGWLVDRMRALKFFSAFADEAGNAVGILGGGVNQLVLLGHIDTVSGEIPVRLENGILHGRGAVDAKGPLAAFIDAAARVGPVPDWQIVVIGAVDEEGESAGAWHISSRYHPRFAVIGEPSGWDRVALGYRGVMGFQFRASQSIGHSASSDAGVCEKAVGFWNQLAEMCERENNGFKRKFEQVTPALRTMNSTDDGLVERAEINGNVRLPQRIFPERMKVILSDAAAQFGGSLEVTGGIPLPAFRVEKATPVVGALLAGIRSQHGDPSFSLKLGTSDMNVVGPIWNCPMAVYGPGDSALDHTPLECISLEEYERAVEVLAFALQRLTTDA